MSRTTIEWTEYSWNPMRGCSPKMRCAPTCWACRMANRQKANPKYQGFVQLGEHGPEWTGKVALIEEELGRPLHWKTPRRIAVALMGDLFRLPAPDILAVFQIMAKCPRHTFMLLTKAPHMALRFVENRRWRSFGHCADIGGEFRAALIPGEHRDDDSRYLPNVFLGVSCLDQADADAAFQPMRELAAAGWRTWVSHEPAWGEIDWSGWEFLSYMVSGGATGPGARPSHPDWFRADRDFCAKHGIPWMFKQWGKWRPRQPGDPDRGEMIRLTRLGRNGQDLANVMKGGGDVWMQRFSKRAAGRLLDGREHLAVPEVGR